MGLRTVDFLFLPVRAAFGAAALIGTATLASRAGLSQRAIAASGFSAFGVSQMIFEYLNDIIARTKERSNKEKLAELELSGVMAWNEAIGAIRKMLEMFSDGLVTPFKLKRMLVDVDVLRRHHTTSYEEKRRMAWEETCEDDLEKARHFASFAMASYGFFLLKLLGLIEKSHDFFVDGTRPLDIVMHQLDLHPSDVLMANLDGHQLGLPRHYIALDSCTKSIVIVVRGTNSVADVLLDLLCHTAPFASGYAHSGMRNAAQALFAVAEPVLRNALMNHSDWSIVTAGHSLGAGVAILLTKILMDNGYPNTKCYAISPPPVYGPLGSIDATWSSALECFVHEDDLVPRLSLKTARVLALEIERIDGLPFSDQELKSLSSRRLHVALEEARNLRSDTRDESVLPLYIPANHVHWLLCVDQRKRNGELEQRYKCFRVDIATFERIVVTRGCVQSHFPNTYIAAFDSFELKEPKISTKRKKAKQKARPGCLWYNGELGH